MTDLEVIQSFYGQISWANKCAEINNEGRTILLTPCTLSVPSHFEHYEQNFDFAVRMAQPYSLKPELIVWGNPSKYDAEKICWKIIASGGHVVFIDAEARITYSRFVLRSLDGMNLQQTFENFTPKNPKIVWDWDKTDKELK